MKTAYIHIGTEKTGSTSIQQLLSNNRKQLDELGYHLADIQHGDNHLDFVAYCIDRFPSDQQQALLSLLNIHDPVQHLHWKETFKEKVKRLLLAIRQTKNLVITSEHFHSRIKSVDEVAQLRELLSPHYQRFKVILYFRRQDQLALSLFNEAIKYGGTCKNPLIASHKPNSLFFDYVKLVEMWAYVFGKENLSARIFEPPLFHQESLYKDFLNEIDITETKDFIEPPKANLSLNGYQQHLLLFLNEIAQQYGPRQQPYNDLRTQIINAKNCTGLAENFQISNIDREQFLSHFTEMNQILTENWLNGKAFSPVISQKNSTNEQLDTTATTPTRKDLEDSLTKEILAYLDTKKQATPEEKTPKAGDFIHAISGLTPHLNADNRELIQKKLVEMH